MELLVAMVLGAVLLTLIAQVFQLATNTQKRVQHSAADLAELRRAYEVMSRDMHSAVTAPDDSGLQFGTTAAAGGSGSIGANVLQLATNVGEPLLAQRQVSQTVLVQYAISDDPRTGKSALWRYETPYPVPDGSQPGSSSDTKPVALLSGVAGATYLFYSLDQQTWLDSWDGQTGLPGAIRVDLAIQSDPNNKDSARQETWTFTLPAAKFATDQADAAANAAANAPASSGTSGTGTQ